MMRPENEAELAELIAGVDRPISVIGGGTRGFETDGAKLTTSGLSGVILYEPGSLTLVARSGTPVSEIEEMLAGEGQRLAFEPMDHRGLLGSDGTPTIGGVVSANVSGPRRLQSGACRDFLLGVQFVDGAGVVVKNGGRVMKNVTGYDLVKLMAGSFGTLGVLTEVSLKVMPMPEAGAVVLIKGLSDAVAVEAMSVALTAPFDVSGAAHSTSGPDGEPLTMIRVEGFAQSVTYRARQLQALLAGYGDSSVEDNPEKVDALWRWVRDVGSFQESDSDVWRISCKPSEASELSARIGADGLLYDWGGGLIWASAVKGTDVRAKLGDFGGHATIVRADPETLSSLGRFQPETSGIAKLTKGLRAKFDPRGILNAGLMG